MISRDTILYIILGVLVLFAGWYFLLRQDPSISAVTASEPRSGAESTFIQLAGELEPISFDASILSDPRFTSLVDISTVVVAEPVGRRDPFAPLGATR